MIDIVDIRKEELKKKAESFEESFKIEYKEKFKDTSTILKFAIIGGGILATVFLSGRIIKSFGGINKLVKTHMMPEAEESGRSGDLKVNTTLKDKLTIIILDIFRQLTIAVLDKLKSLNGKPDL